MMQFGDDTQTHDLARENETLRTEVERLTKIAQKACDETFDKQTEINRLRADNERLRTALQEIIALQDRVISEAGKAMRAHTIARAALEPKPDLRALLPELAVIRQVMKEPKP